MARKQNNNTPPNHSPVEKKNLIAKLNRTIQKLDLIDTSKIMQRNEASVTIADAEIEGVLQELFGPESPRYQQYCIITPLDTAPTNLYHETPIEEVRDHISKRIIEAVKVLSSIKDDFQYEVESLKEAKETDLLEVYSGLKLHSRIAAACDSLFKSGHYSEAVEASVKALIHYVKEKSGASQLDGTPLMLNVFSSKSPILKLNDLTDQSDIDEQQGFMHLFAGTVLGIRNPRAHSFIVDTQEKAIEFIGFISLLAKYVDIAKKQPQG